MTQIKVGMITSSGYTSASPDLTCNGLTSESFTHLFNEVFTVDKRLAISGWLAGRRDVPKIPSKVGRGTISKKQGRKFASAEEGKSKGREARGGVIEALGRDKQDMIVEGI